MAFLGTDVKKKLAPKRTIRRTGEEERPHWAHLAPLRGVEPGLNLIGSPVLVPNPNGSDLTSGAGGAGAPAGVQRAAARVRRDWRRGPAMYGRRRERGDARGRAARDAAPRARAARGGDGRAAERARERRRGGLGASDAVAMWWRGDGTVGGRWGEGERAGERAPPRVAGGARGARRRETSSPRRSRATLFFGPHRAARRADDGSSRRFVGRAEASTWRARPPPRRAICNSEARLVRFGAGGQVEGSNAICDYDCGSGFGAPKPVSKCPTRVRVVYGWCHRGVRLLWIARARMGKFRQSRGADGSRSRFAHDTTHAALHHKNVRRHRQRGVAAKASAFTARPSVGSAPRPPPSRPSPADDHHELHRHRSRPPRGPAEIECADDTYGDAAEVRDPRRLQRRGSRRSAIRRATGPGRVPARASAVRMAGDRAASVDEEPKLRRDPPAGTDD